MGINERKQKEKDKLRQKILNTAKDILIEKGLGKLTMRAVAERIDYSPTTIYLYFKNKEELTFHLLEYSYQILVEALQEGEKQTYSNSIERLKAGLTLYIKNGLKYSNFYKIMTTPIIDFKDPEMALKEGTMNKKAFSILQEGVEICIKNNELKPGDPFNTAKMLWVAIHGVTILLIDACNFPWGDIDQFIKNYVDFLIRGLKGGTK